MDRQSTAAASQGFRPCLRLCHELVQSGCEYVRCIENSKNRTKKKKMRLLTYHISQRENGIGSFLCFLVIVFDFHIDNMHRSIQFLPTAQQILYMCEFFFIARQTKIVYAPSQTLSKQRSSHVITTSETRRHSCQRSGADLMCRLRSNIGKSPLAS